MEKNEIMYLMSLERDCGYDGYTKINICVSFEKEKLEKLKTLFLKEYESFNDEIIKLNEDTQMMIKNWILKNPGICTSKSGISQIKEESYKKILDYFPIFKKLVKNNKEMFEEMMNSYRADDVYDKFKIEMNYSRPEGRSFL